jgi:hypothetical protein
LQPIETPQQKFIHEQHALRPPWVWGFDISRCGKRRGKRRGEVEKVKVKGSVTLIFLVSSLLEDVIVLNLSTPSSLEN